MGIFDRKEQNATFTHMYPRDPLSGWNKLCCRVSYQVAKSAEITPPISEIRAAKSLGFSFFFFFSFFISHTSPTRHIPVQYSV